MLAGDTKAKEYSIPERGYNFEHGYPAAGTAEMPPAKIAATLIKASTIGTKAASLPPSGVSIGSISAGIKMSFRNLAAMRTHRSGWRLVIIV